MNAIRRKKLQAIIEAIEDLKSQLEYQQTDLEEIKYEEAECLENLPESLYGSEKYERAETASNSLEEAYDTLSDLVSQLEDVTSYIEEAINA